MSDNEQFRIGDVVRTIKDMRFGSMFHKAGLECKVTGNTSEGLTVWFDKTPHYLGDREGRSGLKQKLFTLVYRPPTRAEHEALQARVAELEAERDEAVEEFTHVPDVPLDDGDMVWLNRNRNWFRFDGAELVDAQIEPMPIDAVLTERDEARAELARYEAAAKSATVEGGGYAAGRPLRVSRPRGE